MTLVSLTQNVWGQGYGIPFFRNFSASEYGGDERSFDIECDDKGYVFVANFTGLVYYDGVDWHREVTPGISRILALCKADDGKMWFGGSSVVGYAVPTSGGVRFHYVADEKNGKLANKLVMSITQSVKEKTILVTTQEGYIYRVDGDSLHLVKNSQSKLNYSTGKNFYIDNFDLLFRTIPSNGVVARDGNGDEIYHLTAADGLCSDNITDIAYDGKGCIWGTTDNGIFLINSCAIYTRFGEREGLLGKVYSINETRDMLLVGTLQGLYILQNGKIRKEEKIDRACWQIVVDDDGCAVVASANGVFRFEGESMHPKLVNRNSRNSLSLLLEGDGGVLCGTTDGLYRYDHNGNETPVDVNLRNVARLERDDKGGIWATTMDKATYYKAPGQNKFVLREDGDGVARLQLHYFDDKHNLWHADANGKGLYCDKVPERAKCWLQPFADLEIQTVYVKDGIAWLGGAFGLYRYELKHSIDTHLDGPKVYIRDFDLNDRDLKCSIAIDVNAPLGTCYYSYRLHDREGWSRWTTEKDLNFNKMAYGEYRLQVRAKDMYGRVAVSAVQEFKVHWPWYLKWYVVVWYFIIATALSLWFYMWRINRVKRQKMYLERIVGERTKELKDAHLQLLRKEKEATAGKLTRGLIDRILNPMNYINNFSHLTLGLVKDLRGDVEDLSDEDAGKDVHEDAKEDAEDVLDMMNQNLEKIEQHGLSTTRILKAMEEMLKERKGKIEPADVAHICQQCVEMTRTYFADDISRIGIQLVWKKPEYPIAADVISEQLSKVLTSMLANSVYAVKKKATDVNLNLSGYVPTIELRINPASGTEAPHIIIHDNGIGIEEGIIDKVFDPFFTTKPTGEAPGVGLYLAKQFIEDIGGTVSLESVKNEWTEFDIALP